MLEPPHGFHEGRDESLLLLPSELQPAPALRQPDVLAAGDQLKRQQHRNDLEDVRCAAGGQRQRRDAEKQDEEDRKAPLPEELNEAS